MKTLVLLINGFLLMLFAFGAMAEDVLRVAGFSRDPVSLVAEGKDLFKTENIRVEFSQVTNSVDFMRNFIKENYDVIHTNADNVIAWAEGQGEDPKSNDFIIFIGGNKSVTLDLVVTSVIHNFADLKGKVMAVDDPRTGYAPVLVYMLKKSGLTLNKDYTLKPVGDGRARADSMSRGEASGALLNLSEDELRAKGFRKLAQSQDYLPVYARGVGAARKAWAGRNEALLVRYIRALVRSTDWLLDPKNRDEATALFLRANQGSQRRAERMYKEAVDANTGFIPRARIDTEGIKVIIQLREVMGAMRHPLPLPDKYVDDRFYKKAVSTLTQ